MAAVAAAASAAVFVAVVVMKSQKANPMEHRTYMYVYILYFIKLI